MAACGLWGMRPRVLVRLAVALCGEQVCARRRLQSAGCGPQRAKCGGYKVPVSAPEFDPTLNSANHFPATFRGEKIKNSLCELSEINR